MKNIRKQSFFFLFISASLISIDATAKTQKKADKAADVTAEKVYKLAKPVPRAQVKSFKPVAPQMVYRKGLIFEQKYAAQAEAQIQKIAQQLRGVKTVGAWMNRAPKKEKLQRRQNFSDVMSSPMPSYAVSRYSIIFADPQNKKQTHNFTLFPEKSGVVTLLDGMNISPKKSESFQNWRKRISRNQRTASWIEELLVPRAYAAGGFDEFRFSEMLRLMSNIDWENFDVTDALNGGTGGVNDGGLATQEKLKELQEMAGFLRNNYGLMCERDGSALLTMQLVGRNVDFRVSSRENPNNRDFRIQVGNKNHGEVRVSSDGSAAVFDHNGRTYSHEMLVPALVGSLKGIDLNKLPETSPARSKTTPVEPDEIVSAYEGVRACQTLHAAGITACDDKIGDTRGMAMCAGEIMKAGLPSLGMFGALVNRSPLADLDRQQALDVKFQLAAIYYDYPVNFDIGTDFPAERTSEGRPGPSYSGRTPLPYNEIASAFEVDYDENDVYHTAMRACVREAQAGNGSRGCSNPDLRNRNPQDSHTIQDVLGGVPVLRNRISDLNTNMGRVVAQKDACSQGFVDNKMLAALEQYDRMSIFNNDDRANKDTELRLNQMLAAADAARAACGNKQLREGSSSPAIAQ